jgi:hypothetical protein
MNDLLVKEVDLFGDNVTVAKDNNGVVWVGIRWICQGMGMTDGQYKRQITNIQNDLLLKDSGSNLILNKGSGDRTVFCLKLDYLPMWLAKITITEKTRKERPEFIEKLLQYQLKAKDILAAAFLPQYAQQLSDRQYTKADIPVGEVARLSIIMDRIMVRQNSRPHDIARAFEMLCGQFGIMLPDNFVKAPEYEQLTLESLGK